MTLILLISFMIFYLQFAAVSVFGSFAQYGTFMAARALLPARVDPERQISAATRVLKRTVVRGGQDRFPAFAKADIGVSEVGDVPGAVVGAGPFAKSGVRDRDFSWQKGVSFKFKGVVSFIMIDRSTGPPSPTDTAKSGISLTTEAWLGREEPAMDNCQLDIEGNPPGLVVFDNGC